MSTDTVRVELGDRSYNIAIGTGNLRSLGQFVQAVAPATHALLCTDDNVAKSHAHVAAESLQQAGVRVDFVSVAAGENAKSIAVAESLWNECARRGVDRKTVVAAVGGGVIGDLAGFVAASYTRGLRFVQVPTTLLAQVDSSVGGKVGINLPSAKNMVGAFWQPAGVLIDTDVLNTLPDREYRSGLAEVVKYGVILDANFFEFLEANVDAINRRESDVLRRIVIRCCQLKAEVVQGDEYERTGLRAVLNYGHTFAHALENVLSYGTLLHGEAVSIGMMCAMRLAATSGRVDATLVERQRILLESLRLPVKTPHVAREAVVQAMSRDKKVEHGKWRFVLPSRLGAVELVENTPPEQALAAMEIKNLSE